MTPENPLAGQDHQLVELTDALIERMRSGEAIDEDALLEQYPQFQSQLREMIATIQLVSDLGTPQLQVDASSFDTVPPDGAPPSLGLLGDFRLCREIGRGGMGVVYEAVQLSLNRHVALKVLPFAAVLDARQLARFNNEAQAAAALSHPHIVPVYGVGCVRGVHYYAMQLIHGQTLATINAELKSLQHDQEEAAFEQVSRITWDVGTGKFDSDDERAEGSEPPADRSGTDSAADTKPVSAAAIATDREELSGTAFFRTIARLGIQAAEALQHAHEHGVIHRDIKPGNLMLDASGLLWITDFGLAHLESNASVTLSGDVLGTVRYMSPEQAHVRSGVVDHRSDIYSLGVTLYELLTQHRAFPGENRQELLHQIGELEPRHPMKHNPAVPSELETIVLKAMRKTPSDRYAAAADMADDLQRFLDHRPILAKPPTWSEIAFKWIQRNHTFVTVAVCSLLLAVVALAVSNWRVAVQRDAARRASIGEHRQALEASRQKKLAIKNYELALQAINQMLHRVGDKGLKNVPMMQEVRVDVTEEAVALLERLDDLGDRDERVELEIGRAYYQLGRLQSAVGRQKAAITSSKKAIEFFKGLQRTTDSPVEIQQRLIATYRSLANTLRDLGRFEDAVQLYEQAESIGEQLQQQPGVADEARRDIALCRANRALALVEMGSPDAAEPCYEDALAIARKLVDDEASVDNLTCLGTVQYNLGGLYLKQQKLEEAEALIGETIDTFTLMIQEPRVDPGIRQWLAISHGHLGVLYYRTSRLDLAEQAYREQIQTLTNLSKDFPAVPSYRHEAAVGRGNLASVLRAQGHRSESGDELSAAITTLRALVADFPDVHMYREHLADFQLNAGNRSLSLAEPKAAIEYYLSGFEAYQQLSSAFPDREDLRESLAIIHTRLGIAHHMAGNAEASDRSYRQAIQGYRKLAATSDNSDKYVLGTASIQWKFGDDLIDRDAVDEGERAYLDSTDTLERLLNETPEDAALQAKMARQYANLAVRLLPHWDSDDREERVIKAYKRSLDLASSLVDQSPESDEHRSLLSTVQFNCAITFGDLGRETVAWQMFQKSLEGTPPKQIHTAAAWFLSTCTDEDLRDVKSALEHAQKGTEAMPDNSFSWVALALAQHRSRQADASRRSVAKALEIDGGNSAHAYAAAALISAAAGKIELSRAESENAEKQLHTEPGPHTVVIRRVLEESRIGRDKQVGRNKER